MLNAAIRSEIERIAAKHAVPAQNLMAIVEVESAGTVFWTVKGQPVPAARPEAHYFHRILKGAQRSEAVRQGLAHPRAGVIRVPASREAVYGVIERMKKINESAALESCSWGVGQVMGENWRTLAYSSVQELVGENYSGVSGQIECMMRFIIKNGLLTVLRSGDFETFARRYNGPAYRTNQYDTKMAAAAKKYARVLQGPKQERAVANEEVRKIQTDLTTLGCYSGEVSGFENDDLRASIRQFQTANGLVADGLYGKMTADLVEKMLKEKSNQNSNRLIGAGVSGTAISSLGETLLTQLQMLGSIPHLKIAVTMLTILCVGLIAYGAWRKFRNGELA